MVEFIQYVGLSCLILWGLLWSLSAIGFLNRINDTLKNIKGLLRKE